MPSWYVQNMNVDNFTPPGTEHYRSLQILDELSNNDSLTQRDLSSRLGIALGLVNSYIKNLVKKGFITVKTIPTKRYAYYLTPKGFAEKTRLTYAMLSDYTRVYREARKNLKQIFHELQKSGVRKIVFAGTDEIAEVAYITLQESSIELAGVADSEKHGEIFFGREIKPLSAIHEMTYDQILITTHLKKEAIYHDLVNTGIDKRLIKQLFTLP